MELRHYGDAPYLLCPPDLALLLEPEDLAPGYILRRVPRERLWSDDPWSFPEWEKLEG